MRARTVWLAGAVVASVVVGTALAISLLAPGRQKAAVAVVNGVVISKADLDEYAAVFTDPNGVETMPRDQVLLSLINQALVHEEASRAQIAVTERDVDAAVANVLAITPADAPSIRRAGGVDGLRRRMRAHIEFERVQSVVVEPVTVDSARASGPGVNDVELDRRWNAWLRAARDCATVIVADASLGLPSSTPAAGCAARSQ